MHRSITFTSNSPSHSTISAEVHESTATTASSPCGLVVVAYGTDGLLDTTNRPWATMIRGYADSLSQSGLTVLIPDFFAATNTSPGIQAAEQIESKRDLWLEVISETIDYGMKLPLVDPQRVGILGFSLGGYLCLRLRSKVRYMVEYFAPVLDGIGLGSNLTHCQIHHGKDDKGPATAFSNASAIERTLQSEGTVTELFPYPGAGHGFVGNDPANTDARDKSQQRTIAFFESHLK